MNENEIAKVVVDAAYKVHTKVGPGLLESAYQAILVYELKKRGFSVQTEVAIPIEYEEITVEIGYRADIIVENKIIIELKSLEKTSDIHKKQLLTYLKASGLHLGLLINFGAPLIKDGITRIVNNL